MDPTPQEERIDSLTSEISRLEKLLAEEEQKATEYYDALQEIYSIAKSNL